VDARVGSRVRLSYSVISVDSVESLAQRAAVAEEERKTVETTARLQQVGVGRLSEARTRASTRRSRQAGPGTRFICLAPCKMEAGAGWRRVAEKVHHSL
jgi:hypothetical protein